MRLAIIIVTVSIFLMVGISIAQKDSQQTPSKSKEMPKEIIGKDGAKMVLIPAGEFLMGTDPSEIPELVKLAKQWYPDAKASWIESWFRDETPRHTVYVDAFYMDAYEVTNAQYKKFVQATGHKEPEAFAINRVGVNNGLTEVSLESILKPWETISYNVNNQPVVCVSWEDAKAYAEWAGRRLPTEAEWEYSARGGLAVKRYVWSDDWPPPKSSGNFADEAVKKALPDSIIINGYDDGYTYPAPVGSFKPNGYGLYDMAGNVWEWCADLYDNKYYANSPKLNPKGPDSGFDHVLRGSSWCLNDTDSLRVADRYHFAGYVNFFYFIGVGFRCVVSATP